MNHYDYMAIHEQAAEDYKSALAKARMAYDFVLSTSMGEECPTVVEAFHAYRRAEWNAYAAFISITSQAYTSWL